MDRQLIDYLPPVLSDKKEYIELFKSEQLQIESLVEKIECCFENQFISSSDVLGISKYEKLLKIIPKGTDDLVLRRFRVLAKYNEQLPYTYHRLVEMLNSLCGEGNLFIKVKDLKLSVYIKLSVKDKFDDVKELLRRVIPANVALDLSILYNQWKMAKNKNMKWKDVKEKSWELMKNEVME